MEVSTGDKIKVFKDTDVEAYINYIEIEKGFEAELDGDYIIVGEPYVKHIDTSYAKQIKFFRKLRNMSREELAEKCLVTEQTVWNWELGRCIPREWWRVQKVLRFENVGKDYNNSVTDK